MNFPVEENALGMSTRQIGWEKRKRVKEATTATAVTATSSFNLLLDLSSTIPRIFSHFPISSPVVFCSLYAPVFLPASYVRLSFLQKLSSASIRLSRNSKPCGVGFSFTQHLVFQLFNNRIYDIVVKCSLHVSEIMRRLDLQVALSKYLQRTKTNNLVIISYFS